MMMMMWRRRFRFGIWMAMVLQSVALVHGAATRGSTTSFDTRSRRSSLSQSLPSSSGWIRSRGGHPSTMPHPTTKLHYYDVRNWIRGGSDVEAVSSSNEAASPPSTSPANTSYQVSICSVQGGRQYMEDDVFVNQHGNFAAVFDGHGGSAVSRYLRQNLYATLLAALPTGLSSTSSLATVPEPSSRSSNDTDENSASGLVGSQLPTASDYQRAIVTALEKVDQEVQRISHWSFQGSTAVVAWIHEDRQSHNDQTLVVANVGDSRAVLSRNGMAVDLTQDHKPHSRSEKERIERAGGKIVWCGDVDSDGNPIPESGLFRVNGNLALSRAIGDRSERPAVCATPEVTTCQIQDGDEFVVLASDGVFDVMSSQDVVSFVQQELQQSTSEVSRTRIKAHMADMVVAQALQRGTTDNASVVVVWLTPSRHSEN